MAVATQHFPDPHFGMGPSQEYLAHCVARGAVDNMEFVLSDLQNIMGDIQSLVAHIDSVMCRSGRRARRERRQVAQTQSEHGAESNPSQAAEQKAPDPGGSSKPLHSKSSLCMKKTLGLSVSRKLHSHSSIEETKLDEPFKQISKIYKNVQRNVPKRFSDPVLQDTNYLPHTRSFAHETNKEIIMKQRFRDQESPRATIVDLPPWESPVFTEKAQKQRRPKAVASRHLDLNMVRNPGALKTINKDSNSDSWTPLDSPATRRPIYCDQDRDDSLASRGEYDLETQEAKLGNKSDFSDGDQSQLSLEDSPLRLRYFNRTKRDEITVRESVAIVYPIVKSQSEEFQCKEKVSDLPDDIDYYGRNRVSKAAFSPTNLFKISLAEQVQPCDGYYEVPVISNFNATGFVKGSRQSYVYNKAFVPVTPTEQSSLSTSQKILGSRTISDFKKQALTESFFSPKQEHSQSGFSWTHGSLPNSPKGEMSTALKVGFDVDTVNSNKNRLPSCPVYARIEGSPASTRSSCSTVRKPVAHHYYYSIDSDLDSDIVPEYLDPRGLTPDLDWSYLNLIGGEVLDSINTIESKITCLKDYERPINIFPQHQSFEKLEKIPADMSVVPFYHVLASKHSSTPSSSSAGAKESMNDLQEELLSPLLSCTGAINTDNYCGCYESYLDSVLENVAGFETFEAAIESLNNDDCLHETYINFDDQFEEDDWDVGLDSGGVCNLSFDYPITYLDTKNDAEYSDFFSEKPCDIFSTTSSTPPTLSTSLKRPCALSLSKRFAFHSSKTKIDKSKRKQEHQDKSYQRDFKFKFMESENEYVRSSMNDSFRYHSQDYQPIPKSSWTKSSMESLTEELKTDSQKSPTFWDGDCSKLMSVSYDTSCQAVASDSPMSLCSSEEVEFSPTSDRLITSSEGDDLLTSHDESYFLPSPDPSVDNAKSNTAFGKTKASELTQQFLMSLRDIYERHNGAGGASSLSVHYDESIANINNSRDSSSSGLSSENGSTITASTSTATDATLTDDNGADDNHHHNTKPNPRSTNTMEKETQSSSYNEEIFISGGYNRNVNTWTAYAVVHVQADDVSDGTASDALYNDNMLGSIYSITTSNISNENTDVT